MKKIFVTQRVQVIEAYQERRDALSQEWAVFLSACGYLPVLLPNHLETVRRLWEETPPDGVLLTGGNDLAAYGGDAPERDAVERALIEWALANGTPLIGVCRGMQMVLHAFGGTLVPVEGHVRRTHRLDNGDTVNSFHGMAALRCPEPLAATACCREDGVIEAVRHKTAPIYGMMWHPERYQPARTEDMQWFQEVFQ